MVVLVSMIFNFLQVLHVGGVHPAFTNIMLIANWFKEEIFILFFDHKIKLEGRTRTIGMTKKSCYEPGKME